MFHDILTREANEYSRDALLVAWATRLNCINHAYYARTYCTPTFLLVSAVGFVRLKTRDSYEQEQLKHSPWH